MELVTGAPATSGRGCCAGWPARAAVRALARRPERLEPLDGVEPVRGDLVSGAGLAEALEGVATAYYLVHSMEAVARPTATPSPTVTARPPSASRAPPPRPGVERIVYLGGIEPPAARGRLLSQLRGSRSSASCSTPSPARPPCALDRDRRRVGLVSDPGPARRAAARAAAAGLAPQPHPAGRRARRDRVPRAHARGAGAAGRSLDMVGPDVISYAEMIEQIAEAMGVGRMPLGLGASLTSPAAAVVAAVTGQPLELGAPVDGEPRVRPAAARPATRRRASTASARWASSAPSSARCASGSRSSRWGRDEGRAHHSHRRVPAGGLRHRHGSEAVGGLGDCSPPPRGARRCAAARRARSSPRSSS